MFREHLIHFSNVKCIIFFKLELVHYIGRFTIGKGGDGISKIGVRVDENHSVG